MIGNGKSPIEHVPPRPADVRAIGDALRSLWQDCCPEQPGGDVARALTKNVVVIAESADEAPALDAVERLYRRSPCRVFVALVDDGAARIEASVAAAARCHGATRDIVLEQILLRVPRAGIARLPGLVRPLLVNDLPNHLYWRLDWPADENRFAAVAGLCEHTVLDSRRLVAAAADLDLLERLRASGRHVTDLAWLRLRPWRRALAEAFEPVAWRPGTAVRGAVRHAPTDASGARIVARWLEQRLGAAIDLDESGTGDPDHVRLDVADAEITAELDHGRIVVRVSTASHCYLPFGVPASRGTEGDLLAAALDLAR